MQCLECFIHTQFPLYTFSPRSKKNRAGSVWLKEHQYSLKKKKIKILFPVMDHRHTPAEIIIQNYDALISHLSKSNFGDYILWLCSLSVQKLIWHYQVMDYSLYILTKPRWAHHGLQGANCARRCDGDFTQLSVIWFIRTWRSNLPPKLCF